MTNEQMQVAYNKLLHFTQVIACGEYLNHSKELCKEEADELLVEIGVWEIEK